MKRLFHFYCCLLIVLSCAPIIVCSMTSIPAATAINIPQGLISVWEEVRSQLAAGKPIGITNIPLLNKIPLNPHIKEFLDKIQIHTPQLELLDSAVALKGQVDLFGVPVNSMLYFALDNVASPNLSFYLTIPQAIKLSNFLPALSFLDTLAPPFVIFALSTSDYEFKDLEIDVKPGLNMFTMLKVGGPIQELSDLLGSKLNQVEVYGSLHPKITGSTLTGSLPGRLNLGPIKTTGLQLVLEVDETAMEVRVPAFSIKTGFIVDWPQEWGDPKLFEGALKLTPIKGEIWGKMEGNLDLITIAPAKIQLQEARFTAEVDWKQLVSTRIPISGAGVQGKVAINPKSDRPISIDAAVKIAVTSSGGLGDFVLSGKLDGQIHLEEFIDWFALQIREISRGTTMTIDLMPMYQGKIPNMSVQNPFIEIVPKNVTLADKFYEQRIGFGGELVLLNTRGIIFFNASLDGIQGLGYVDNIIIGPLKFVAALPAEKGPRIDFKLNLKEQYFYLSGNLELDILGGIKKNAIIALAPAGLYLKLTTQLFDQFETDLELRASVITAIGPDNFFLKAYMKQSFLNFLHDAMLNFASGLVPQFNKDVHNEFERVEGEINRVQHELDTEYNKCMSPPWNWDHARCTLFWGEIIKRNLEIGGLFIYRDAILKPGTTIARGIVGSFASVTNFAALLLAKGFNIESFEFEGRLDQFAREGKLPKVSIVITALGKRVVLTDLQFNFNDIQGSVNNIFNQLSKFFV